MSAVRYRGAGSATRNRVFALNFKRNNFVRPFNSRRLLRQHLPAEYIFSASESSRALSLREENRGKSFRRREEPNVVGVETIYIRHNGSGIISSK